MMRLILSPLPGAVTYKQIQNMSKYAESEHSLASLHKHRAGTGGQERPGLGVCLTLRNAGSCNGNIFPVLTGLVGETALALFK